MMQSSETRVITIERDVAATARMDAARFREAMTARGTLVVNLLSSPGSGKTTLLAETAKRWGDQVRCGVLAGDIATDRDAQRLAPWLPVIQLTTGGACHLSLALVQQGWQQWEDRPLDILFIENVGNLVCPSSHDLGEHVRVVLLATTEGDDKPAKYPKAFRTSDGLLITKTDLLPYLPFDVDAAGQDARAIRPDIEVMAVSALQGEGIAQWCEFLQQQRRRHIAIEHANNSAGSAGVTQ
jgi:hydrogenase nickel incorporation protein HypB